MVFAVNLILYKEWSAHAQCRPAEFGCKFGANETMFSPSCDRSCVKKKEDQFVPRRYSLKTNFGK